MQTHGIFKTNDLKAIESLKKNFLHIGVYVLIGGVILGAALILAGGTEASEYISKTLGMVLVFALMMLISANNFKILESSRASAQTLALVGLVMNFVWGILWILAIWQVFDVLAYKDCNYGYGHRTYRCTDGFSIMGQVAMVATYLSAFGFFGSNVLNLKEYERGNAIKPLKITSLVCLTYATLYGIAMAFAGMEKYNYNDRMAILANFAIAVWLITWIIAAVLTRSARKKLETDAKITAAAEKLAAEKTAATEPTAPETITSTPAPKAPAPTPDDILKEILG